LSQDGDVNVKTSPTIFTLSGAFITLSPDGWRRAASSRRKSTRATAGA
jgi:hypothetical protein